MYVKFNLSYFKCIWLCEAIDNLFMLSLTQVNNTSLPDFIIFIISKFYEVIQRKWNSLVTLTRRYVMIHDLWTKIYALMLQSKTLLIKSDRLDIQKYFCMDSGQSWMTSKVCEKLSYLMYLYLLIEMHLVEIKKNCLFLPHMFA